MISPIKRMTSAFSSAGDRSSRFPGGDMPLQNLKSLYAERGLSQSWGSGGHRHWRVWVVGRQELLPETGAERAVVEGAAELEQQIGPAPGPAHLLRLGHAAVHQEVGRALGQRRADPQPGPVPFGVIDQMGALGA